MQFQSTRPARARPVPDVLRGDGQISIHSPCAGETCRKLPKNYASWHISIHSPCAGETRMDANLAEIRAFQSTRPARARLVLDLLVQRLVLFQSTRPARARQQTVPKAICKSYPYCTICFSLTSAKMDSGRKRRCAGGLNGPISSANPAEIRCEPAVRAKGCTMHPLDGLACATIFVPLYSGGYPAHWRGRRGASPISAKIGSS